MRAERSAISSCSSRSSRRIAWLSRPRISARLRATGTTSRARPFAHRRRSHGRAATPRARPPRGPATRSRRATARAPPRSGPSDRAGAAGILDAAAGLFEHMCIHGAQGYARRRMRSSDLDYALPPELIAQTPTERRDASRLLVVERATGAVAPSDVRGAAREIGDALVVVNDTRVVPARLRLERASGGRVEMLLLESLGEGEWEALARPSRRLRPGRAPRAGRAARAARRGALARPARGRARGGDAAAARTSTSRSPIPERYQTVSTRARRAPPRRPPPGSTSRRSCSPACRTSASRCTSGSTRSGRSRRGPRRAPAARRALRRRAGRLGAHRSGAAGPRGGHDDDASARDGRRRRAPLAGTLRALHHARASSSGGSTPCSRTSTCPGRRCWRS